MFALHHFRPVHCIVQLLLALAFVVASPLLYAEEIRYVSDELSLKMYKDSALSVVLPSLKSGDRVVVLKKDDGYFQVKTDDGTVGWVKGNYLEKEKTAALKLIEIQKELDDLRSKHTDLLIEQPVAQEPQDEELMARVQAAESAQHDLKQRMKELEAERMGYLEQIRQLRQQQDKGDESRQMLLWIILPILALISGFFIGFKYLEGKVKARFGGYNPL